MPAVPFAVSTMDSESLAFCSALTCAEDILSQPLPNASSMDTLTFEEATKPYIELVKSLNTLAQHHSKTPTIRSDNNISVMTLAERIQSNAPMDLDFRALLTLTRFLIGEVDMQVCKRRAAQLSEASDRQINPASSSATTPGPRSISEPSQGPSSRPRNQSGCAASIPFVFFPIDAEAMTDESNPENKEAAIKEARERLRALLDKMIPEH